MTLARRLSAVEAKLSPTQLVVRWLDEAHAFGSLEAYTDSLLAGEPRDFPLNRLCREAYTGAMVGVRGVITDQVAKEVNGALRATAFRFELVMRINVSGHELVEKDQLLEALFSAQLALLATEDRRLRRADPSYLRRLALVRDLVAGRATELRAAQKARALAEQRYLDGHAALFPDVAATWEQQLPRTSHLVETSERLAELDGIETAAPDDPVALAARVDAFFTDLVEPAKATALEKLGGEERAMGIATTWLRAKWEPREPGPGAAGSAP